jgi:HEAT repeat protein
MKSSLLLVIAALAAPAAPVNAQTAPPPPTARRQVNVETLAKGWTALAAGRAAEAEAIADAMLIGSARGHDATSLKIRASVAARRETAALDGYERWVTAVHQEDVFLLQPIAVAVLDTLSLSTDRVVRLHALGALAAQGDAQAKARLAELATGPTGAEADEVLAATGDRAAIGRLRERVAAGGGRDVSGDIDALREAKARDAIPAITAALAPSNPAPTRMAAARALGQLGVQEAIPQLKQAAQDQDIGVRILATAALAQLGDPSGQDALRELARSPVADIRLLAVEGSASADPNGEWVGVARGALQDADPLVRLRAAGLIAKYASDPRPGVDAIQQALADPNPAMQAAAGTELGRVPAAALAADIPALRRGLRSGTAEVRLAAANALLKLAGGVE